MHIGCYIAAMRQHHQPDYPAFTAFCRLNDYKPFTGEEVLYALLDDAPHIEAAARTTASLILDPCNPTAGSPTSSVSTQYDIGGCVLTVWNNIYTCGCPKPSFPELWQLSQITRCGNNYVTERYILIPGGCNLPVTRNPHQIRMSTKLVYHL